MNIPKKISSMKFGLLSEQEILRQSVVQVKEVRKNNILSNTIFDPKLGATKHHPCDTCKGDEKTCQGHFGHIDLGLYIPHPLFYKDGIRKFLRLFCYTCSRLIVDEDFLNIHDLLSLDENGINFGGKFSTMINKDILYKKIIETQKICVHCGNTVMKYVYLLQENKICIEIAKNKKTHILTDVIKRIFDNIIDSDLKLLGIDPKFFHPKNTLIRYLPVLPIPCRPSIYMNGNSSDADISNMLNDIVKEVNKNEPLETKESKILFRVSVMMDNKKKIPYPNGKVKQCVKASINGKKGIIREDLQGSRVLFSARTVLGGDSTIETDQIIVPDYIAEFVTTPEIVTKFNFEKLSKLVNEGKAPYLYRKNKAGEEEKYSIKQALIQPKNVTKLKYNDIVVRGTKRLKYYSKGDVILKDGDVIIRMNEKGENVAIQAIPEKKGTYKLELGDIVHRNIMENDEVIFNRQPTLSRGSLMSGRVVRKPYGKTIRVPLAITSSLNADQL